MDRKLNVSIVVNNKISFGEKVYFLVFAGVPKIVAPVFGCVCFVIRNLSLWLVESHPICGWSRYWGSKNRRSNCWYQWEHCHENHHDCFRQHCHHCYHHRHCRSISLFSKHEHHFHLHEYHLRQEKLIKFLLINLISQQISRSGRALFDSFSLLNWTSFTGHAQSEIVISVDCRCTGIAAECWCCDCCCNCCCCTESTDAEFFKRFKEEWKFQPTLTSAF